MTTILLIALLLLMIAVVVLYAMLGELASRLPAQGANAANWIQELAGSRIGTSAAVWPDNLLPLARMPRWVLLVLSPTCSTCNKVAAELGTLTDAAFSESVGLVVSAGDQKTGERFIATNAINRIPYFVDEGGAWTTGNFGINTSPTALIFRKGVLTRAYNFGSIDAISEALTTTMREEAH